MSIIIHLENVNKEFPARRGSRDLRGRGGIRDWLLGRKEEKFVALHNISLEMEKGESLGIIGRNGSGKSTLLSLIAGVTLPTTGRVRVWGRIASLLELGAGFNPILTGRENIYLNAGLLGMRRAQVDAVYEDIVRFSGIGEFMEQPVETYSSGMYVRIAFSVAVFVDPDIFIADEVLAVGDAEFQRKCRNKIGELREQGKTIVFVSHDLGIVNTVCERIVLLDKGRMIQRDTPQQTITFYLRQVGREKGIHTFSDGEQEAIHCDGRISLFSRREEVSAPGGFRMELLSLEEWHNSMDAEWEITERTDKGCTATGRMMRLPLRLIWNIHFEDGRLVWRFAMEVERECTISEILAKFFLPTAYTQWLYNDWSGYFPAIDPADVNWNVVAAPEMSAHTTAVLPESDSPLPPLVFQMDKSNPFFNFFWANSDYMNDSRVLCVSARLPESHAVFTKGVHPLLTLSLALNMPREEIMEQVCSDRTMQMEHLTARFEHGQIRLFWNTLEITKFLHVYTSLLINHLWNDSTNLAWENVIPLEDGIRLRGKSRRFPFVQEWEIHRKEDGIALCIWIEALEPLEVREYHTSIALPPAYRHWRTEYEEGDFPDYDKEHPAWLHCNRNYAPGTVIAASGAEMPDIALIADKDAPPVRMTAINTSYDEHARILQALHPSAPGWSAFTPGRHLYFSGSILVSEKQEVKNFPMMHSGPQSC